MPTVVVCRKCKKHECVEDFLRRYSDAEVELARCQKVCEGAVVGFEVDGRMEWFERMEKAKPLAAVLRALDRPVRPLRKPLAKRRVKKFSGRPPR